MNRTLPTLAVLLVLAACGSGGSDEPAMSAQQVAAKVGCKNFHGDSQQLFVRTAGHCDGVPGLYEVASFNSNGARDNWLAIAKDMGGVYLAGNLWVVAAHTPAALKAAQAKVGGEIQ